MPPVVNSRRRRSSAVQAQLSHRRLDRGVARYYRLYELLSGMLREGIIAPGNALPSEPTLCAQYGLSRTTVRHALERLEREGRIFRRQGSGTYARPEPFPRRLCVDLHALAVALPAIESCTTAVTLRFGPASVPAALRALSAEIEASAHLIERLRHSRGAPLSLTSSYIPNDVGRRLRRGMLGRASTMTILDRLGPQIAGFDCSFGAIAADATAARALEVPLGSPLLRVRAVLTDQGGRLRAVMESLCRSDLLQVRMSEPLGG